MAWGGGGGGGGAAAVSWEPMSGSAVSAHTGGETRPAVTAGRRVGADGFEMFWTSDVSIMYSYQSLHKEEAIIMLSYWQKRINLYDQQVLNKDLLPSK